MKKDWINLRGNKLAAFAASPQAAKERSGLIAHLALHGTVTDFTNAVNAKPYPLDYCLEVYNKFPHAADQWLNAAIQSPDLGQRQKVFRAIVDRVTDFGAPQKLLDQVRFEEMDASSLDAVFLSLVLCDLKEVIERHWSVFEQIMSRDTEQKVTIAANKGWDLAGKINWRPSVDNKEKYFICCCQGGLLEQIQNMKVSYQTAYKGFARTSLQYSKKSHAVMEYLWKTYPNLRDLISPDVLVSVARVSLKMSKKLIEHFKEHAPRELPIQSFYICNQAAFASNTKTLELFLPYVDRQMHEMLLVNILSERNLPLLQRVLSLPYIDHTIEELMPLVSEEHQIWAQEVLNQQQAQRLNEVVTPSEILQPKRKI